MQKSKRYYIGLIYFIVLLALTFVRVLFGFSFVDKLSSNEIDVYYTVISQIICMGLIPFSLYLVLYLRKKESNNGAEKLFKDFKFRSPGATILVLSVILGCLLFYMTMGISAIWATILRLLGFIAPISVGTIYTSKTSLVFWIIFTAVLPGFFEEFSHRGLLINSRKDKSPNEAIVFSAILFATMHQNIQQTGYAVLGGLIMGLVFVITRSIFPTMIMHFTNNALSCLLSYAQQKTNFNAVYASIMGNPISILFILMSWVLAIFLLFFIIKTLDKHLAVKNNTKPIGLNLKFKFKFNKEDIFLYGAFILSLSCTVFTYIWGITR